MASLPFLRLMLAGLQTDTEREYLLFVSKDPDLSVWLHRFPVGRQGGEMTEVASASLT